MVWFLSSVSFHMIGKVLFIHKWSIAHNTAVFFSCRMNIHMLQHTAQCAKTHLTNITPWTLVRFASRMSCNMFTKIILIWKWFLTDATLVSMSLCMRSMFRETSWIWIFFGLRVVCIFYCSLFWVLYFMMQKFIMVVKWCTVIWIVSFLYSIIQSILTIPTCRLWCNLDNKIKMTILNWWKLFLKVSSIEHEQFNKTGWFSFIPLTK